MSEIKQLGLEEFVRKIIQTWDETNQIDFLRIYPVFRLKFNLINLWIEVYKTHIKDKNTVYIDDSSLSHQDKLQRLKENFQKGGSKISVSKKNSILNFLISALKNNYIDTDTREIYKVLGVMEESGEDAGCINSIKLNLLKYKVDYGLNSRKVISARTVSEITYKPKFESLSARPLLETIIKNISALNPKDIALELTRQHSELMGKINIHELICASIYDKYNGDDCPILFKLINDFLKVSYYIPTEILTRRKNSQDDQIEFVKKMIKVAFECKELNNYQDFFAIVAGLNNKSIQRLKYLWKSKQDHSKKFLEFEELITPSHNYKNYRKIIDSIGSNNVIPYIGLISSDIKHLLENEIYDSKKNVINWPIYNKLIVILNSFENLNKAYSIPINKTIVTFLDHLNFCSDDDNLYNLSLVVLPSRRNSVCNSVEISKITNNLSESTTSTTSSLNDSTILSKSMIVPSTTTTTSEISDSNIKRKSISISTGVIEHTRRRTVTEPLILNNNEKNDFSREILFNRKGGSTITAHEFNKGNRLSINLAKLDSDTINQDEIPTTVRRCRSLSIGDEKEASFVNDLCVERWDNYQVLTWLDNIGMGEYSNIFKKEEITGFSLTELSESHLKELNIDKMGHRIKIIKSIGQLKSLKK